MSEPTSKFNDLSSETVTKLVSIIVAIVVFAVVLVPIVNGLADGNGDGGDGGSGESEKVVLNTMSEEYRGADFSPYKSWETYYSDTTSILSSTISLTLEDLQNFNDVCSSVDWSFAHIEPLEIDWFYMFMSNGENDSDNLSIGYNTGPNRMSVEINTTSYYFDKISVFSLTVSTDYTLTYSFIHDGSTIEGTFQLKYVRILSDSEYGFVKSTGAISEKFTVGSQLNWWAEEEEGIHEGIISITEDMISDNTLSFNVVADGYTFVYSLNIQLTDTDGVWQFTDPLYNYYGTTVYDQNNNLVENAYCLVDSITTYGYIQSGSGSSTDSAGISGTAGTILKIIPVLVGVGVILAIVALFYDPRNLIKKD